ncbi:MAG: YjjG family noncanonical pyrimidine nucleotidase [Treponema sp.]|nr:YjjG family noncanonical pyrimidine nucleotidase [Treponema sp.]
MNPIFLFDLDQTLLNFHASEEKALEIISKKYGLAYSKDTYSHFKDYNKSLWLELEKGIISRTDLFRLRFTDFIAQCKGESLGLDPLAINNEFIATMAENGVLMDGALEFIKQVKSTIAGCKIYIISNGATINAKGRINSTGLNAFLDRVFVSEEMGLAKPAKEFFDRVLSSIGAKKEECIVIGDSLTSDMAGAKNASIDSVWFMPQAEACSSIENEMKKYDIDYCANTFDELYKVLKKWAGLIGKKDTELKSTFTLRDYFSYEDKESILTQLQALSKEWGAISFLLSLLKEGSFHQKLGKGSLYLLLDDAKLIGGKPTLASFLTFCERDEIESNLKPWIGFVFTSSAYRGHHLAGRIIEHCMNNAAALYPESEYVYVSSDEKGLYEKYGFEFVGKMKSVWGKDSGIFRKKIKDNPWKDISLSDYENHMSLDSVMQLQMMNEMMKNQFIDFPVDTAMVLGIAGGNGLEHVSKEKYRLVYGVDINDEYLRAVSKRYANLSGTLELLNIDLTNEAQKLPKAKLIIANLLIEYIGYNAFQNVIKQVEPTYLSCVIQINTDEEQWVSDSPYLHAFDRLDEVHCQMEAEKLISSMEQIGYKKLSQKTEPLPNGKALERIDFKKQEQ